jgi:hypothetical protein
VIESSLTKMTEQLVLWEAAGDRRSIFLDCYTRMTSAMCGALTSEHFEDPDWVDALLERFAVYYFDATAAWERGDADTPLPWTLAHRATTSRRATTLQLLFAGVNAHINYDLVLTLVDLLDGEWAGHDERSLGIRRRDYDRVNDVITATVDEVQDEVLERHAPALDVVDRILWRADEWLAVRMLTSWRTSVWRRAVRILEHGDPSARPEHFGRCARSCSRRSRIILLTP